MLLLLLLLPETPLCCYLNLAIHTAVFIHHCARAEREREKNQSNVLLSAAESRRCTASSLVLLEGVWGDRDGVCKKSTLRGRSCALRRSADCVCTLGEEEQQLLRASDPDTSANRPHVNPENGTNSFTSERAHTQERRGGGGGWEGDGKALIGGRGRPPRTRALITSVIMLGGRSQRWALADGSSGSSGCFLSVFRYCL